MATAKPSTARSKTESGNRPESGAPKAAPKSAQVSQAADAQKKASAPRKRAGKHAISVEQRAHYVETAAYYIAERRGFVLGSPVDDWIEAEAEVDRLISAGMLGS